MAYVKIFMYHGGSKWKLFVLMSATISNSKNRIPAKIKYSGFCVPAATCVYAVPVADAI